jgi:predicted membrane metal-binding protein
MASLGMVASGQVLTKPICNLKESFFATIFTLPVTMYYFGSINLFGILTNIFVLPMIGPLTYLSMVYVFLPFTFYVLTWLSANISHVIVAMAAYFAQINPIQFTIEKKNAVLCICLVAFLLAIMIKLNRKQSLQ